MTPWRPPEGSTCAEAETLTGIATHQLGPSPEVAIQWCPVCRAGLLFWSALEETYSCPVCLELPIKRFRLAVGGALIECNPHES